MCLYIFNKEKPKLKKARQNIPVWKVIRNDGLGIYYDMKDEDGNIITWQEGYHYTELPDIYHDIIKIRGGRDIECWNITKGLHSFGTYEAAKNWQILHAMIEKSIVESFIVQMYIPKGSLFYEKQEKHRYVSDQLVYLSHETILK